MKPYKLKHTPTGLYYQPHKHRGSNLSKRGKIYQTKANILSIGYYSNGDTRKTLQVVAHVDTLIYKNFKDKFNWGESTYSRDMLAETKASDWEMEEI